MVRRGEWLALRAGRGAGGFAFAGSAPREAFAFAFANAKAGRPNGREERCAEDASREVSAFTTRMLRQRDLTAGQRGKF